MSGIIKKRAYSISCCFHSRIWPSILTFVLPQKGISKLMPCYYYYYGSGDIYSKLSIGKHCRSTQTGRSLVCFPGWCIKHNMAAVEPSSSGLQYKLTLKWTAVKQCSKEQKTLKMATVKWLQSNVTTNRGVTGTLIWLMEKWQKTLQ